MGWRSASLVTLACYGLAMFLVSKSNRIHGGEVACFLQMLGYGLLLILLGFGRADFSRATRFSLAVGGAAAALLVVGTLLMFRAIAAYPAQTALISVITEGWPLITAILMQLTGTPLDRRQWAGAVLMTIGMVLVSYKPHSVGP